MNCYLCKSFIPEDQPFYNDYDLHVCKPCFVEARRCFVCRFPGRALQEVEGLGLECEFCRGNILADGDDPGELVRPIAPFLEKFGLRPAEEPEFERIGRRELRELQSDADVPPEEFMDDFLRYCYPVYYKGRRFFLLPRMTKPTFLVHALIQLAASDIAMRFDLEHLAGTNAFQAFTRGWCHWIGYEAARLLKYDLERRQLRKWPELGAQGNFDHWKAMARFNEPAKMIAYFNANVASLARKHLGSAEAAPDP